MAPAPRSETGVVGWYPATEDVADTMEVSVMVAEVITDDADDIIDDSEDITDAVDML